MVKPDEILVQVTHAPRDSSASLAAAAAAARAPPSRCWGSPVTWLEIVAFVLALWMVCANMRVNRSPGRWRSPARCCTRCCSPTAGCTAKPALQIFFVVVAVWGWWQWLRGTRPTAARCAVRRLTPRAALGAGRAARWPPGRCSACCCDRATDSDVPYFDALPTAGSVDRPVAARPQVRRELAGLARASTSSASALFAYKGAVADRRAVRAVRAAVGGRLARLARAWPPWLTALIVIAIVGAESTGKTTLAAALAQRLAARDGLRVHLGAASYLREWCDARRPHAAAPTSRPAIARAQQRAHRRRRGRRTTSWSADTTALMIAVYSRLLFGDRSLDAAGAGAAPRAMALTLLTALDLPWVADGLQRDGPHVREPVDTAAARAADRAPAAVGAGRRQRRGSALEHALDAVAPLLRDRRRAAPRPVHAAGAAQRRRRRSALASASTATMPECEHAALQRRRSGPSGKLTARRPSPAAGRAGGVNSSPTSTASKRYCCRRTRSRSRPRLRSAMMPSISSRPRLRSMPRTRSREQVQAKRGCLRLEARAASLPRTGGAGRVGVQRQQLVARQRGGRCAMRLKPSFRPISSSLRAPPQVALALDRQALDQQAGGDLVVRPPASAACRAARDCSM